MFIIFYYQYLMSQLPCQGTLGAVLLQDLPQGVDELVDVEELRAIFDSKLVDLRHEFASQLALRTSQAAFNNLPLTLDNGKVVSLQYLGKVPCKPELVFFSHSL